MVFSINNTVLQQITTKIYQSRIQYSHSRSIDGPSPTLLTTSSLNVILSVFFILCYRLVYKKLTVLANKSVFYSRAKYILQRPRQCTFACVYFRQHVVLFPQYLMAPYLTIGTIQSVTQETTFIEAKLSRFYSKLILVDYEREIDF